MGTRSSSDNFWTRHYRLLFSAGRLVVLRDLCEILLLLFIVLAAYYACDPALRNLIVGTCIAISGIRAGLVWRSRWVSARSLSRVFGSLFAYINDSFFGRSTDTRFTIFRPAPFRKNYIVPWWRFSSGVTDLVREASGSRSRYTKDEGHTGIVWQTADADEPTFRIQELPEFKNRIEMEEYFEHVLNVSEETARSISDYMVDVTAIMSLPFVGSSGRFLGLLSVDFRNAKVEKVEHVARLKVKPAAGESYLVDSNSLYALTRNINGVLEIFYAK